MGETVVRYNYRLRPGVGAAAALDAEWDRCRWIWNQCVQAKRSRYWMTDRDLTTARAKFDWLAAGSQNVQQQTYRVFRSTKGRNLKSAKKTRPSLQYTRNGSSIKNGRLRLAGGISIPATCGRRSL